MEYQLARELSRTHAELMDSMSALELMRWKALHEVEREEAAQHAKDQARPAKAASQRARRRR